MLRALGVACCNAEGDGLQRTEELVIKTDRVKPRSSAGHKYTDKVNQRTNTARGKGQRGKEAKEAKGKVENKRHRTGGWRGNRKQKSGDKEQGTGHRREDKEQETECEDKGNKDWGREQEARGREQRQGTRNRLRRGTGNRYREHGTEYEKAGNRETRDRGKRQRAREQGRELENRR
ncbi:conglutin beta 1-like [Penaeus japonicus]|uniref:conglutin beta 1-like n=1 Tax=Penaeus japonicus TaxID=27405 RepID=UPI001C713BA5|nr:conglutin beta 1-like [Penaeus japonicus]